MKKVLINSRTSGKYKEEMIDGRNHLVTTMMPIRGDIAMNRKFYPDEEVEASFNQLEMLPAPHGHPTINGINVPAFHPVANNKHNIGGWLRNARKKGKRVFVDFMLDEEIANNSENGKETIRRIKNGEKIGVSTGLGINTLTNAEGEDDFGKPYTTKVGGYKFDHVAILLNEAAAGEHAGTELVLNEKGEEIEVAKVENTITVNEMSFNEIFEDIRHKIGASFPEGNFTWVRDIFPDSKTFVFSVEGEGQPPKIFKQSFAFDLHGEIELLGDRVEVEQVTEYVRKESLNNNQDEVSEMDKLSIVLAIIGNSANKYTVADKGQLMAKSDDELTSIIATNTVDEKGAQEILANAGHDFEGYENFLANKDKFKAYLDGEEAKLKELRDSIVANSELTAEMLKGKDKVELTALNKLAADPKSTKRAPEGNQSHIETNSDDETTVQVDYSQ